MPQVNETGAVLDPVRRKPPGKRPLPAGRKRVGLPVRVAPATLVYLESMGYPSLGRAIDVLVKAIQHGGIVKMLETGEAFSIVNLAG